MEKQSLAPALSKQQTPAEVDKWSVFGVIKYSFNDVHSILLQDLLFFVEITF